MHNIYKNVKSFKLILKIKQLHWEMVAGLCEKMLKKFQYGQKWDRNGCPQGGSFQSQGVLCQSLKK